MKKAVQIVFWLILLLSITKNYADLNDSINFITGLYNDGFYDLALKEILKIETSLDDEQYQIPIYLIKADILLKQGAYTEAQKIITLLNNKDLSPSLRANALITLAIIERRLGNNKESLALTQSYIEKFPDHNRRNDGFQLMSDIFIEENRFEEAESIYRELHRNNNSELTYINMIRLSLAKNDLSLAKEYLEDLNYRYPKSVASYQQGLLMICTYHESRAEYRSILELCPAQFDEHTLYTDDIILKKIIAHINLKNYDEAQSLIKELKEDSQNIDYYRALIHKEKGDDNQALTIFNRLSESGNTQNIRTMSFFNLVQIIAKNNTREADQLLKDFLVKNPDQDWEADVYYQLAYYEHQNNNYALAYEYVNKALLFNMDDVNRQLAYYLKGDLEFSLQDYEASSLTFETYMHLIPSTLKDEALFKLGLSFFFLNRLDQSSKYLVQLIQEYPNSDKVGIAYFYLGEKELHRNQVFAVQHYQRALSGGMDRPVVHLRLAYAEFLRNDFRAALDYLEFVPETSDYLYDKYLLWGNIYFAQRNYNQALEAYKIAEKNGKDRESVHLVWSRQAWTHYNLKNYDQATALYRRLAEESEDPGRYILSAANAAFNADNYIQALSLYKEYVDTFPDSPELTRAQAGLANSYFNLGQDDAAINTWMDLVNDRNSSVIVESSLKGLQTSYQRQQRLNMFSEFLNLSILRNEKDSFRILLYEYKANFEYEQKNYSSSISTLNQLFRTYPEKMEEQRLMIMLANNYTWANRLEEADKIYLELANKTNDPYIYYEWGHIKWAQTDYSAALTRFKRAANAGENEQYWLTLLEKMVERKDNEFMRYYNQFCGFASEYHQQLARFSLIDWLIGLRDFSEALSIAEELENSSQTQMKAKATMKQGEICFLQNRNDESLTHFLKIRYIFSSQTDLRWEAEFYIIKIYLRQGERQRARENFENIKPNLKPEQVDEFNRLWG